MWKVPSKLPARISEAVADQYGICPSPEIYRVETGEPLRILPTPAAEVLDTEARLKLFDEATRRHRAREANFSPELQTSRNRGWSREDSYERRGADLSQPPSRRE